jgi:hypothetical protein
MALFDLGWNDVCIGWFIAALYIPTNDHRNTTVLIWGTQIKFGK